MPRAKRYHIPGSVWHITHQASQLASTREVGAISGSFFSNLPGTVADASLWIDEAARVQHSRREIRWTESGAVGSKMFVDDIKEKLPYLAGSRKSRETDSAWELREPSFSYGIDLNAENSGIRQNNRYFWEATPVLPDSYSGPTP